MFNKMLEALEPADIYEQIQRPWYKRSVRMLLSDVFYYLVRHWL